MSRPSSDHEIGELRDRIAALESALERAGEPGSDQGSAHRSPAATPGVSDPRGSRRQLLKLAGATALGAAGAAVLTGGQQAGAADGDAITAGNSTLAEQSTSLLYDGSASSFSGVLFLVGDGDSLIGYNPSQSGYSASLAGWASNGGFFGGQGVVPNGVYGLTGNGAGNGVVGENYDANGVGGGNGVLGTASASNGAGVKGTNAFGAGVWGSGNPGVTAAGGSRGLVASGTAAQVQLTPGTTATHPASGSAGDLYLDSTSTLWLCLGGSSWRSLGGPTTAGQLRVLASPVRVYDSRPKGTDPAATGDGPLAPGAERTVSLASGYVGSTATPAVPAGARAALFTLTVVDTSASGFLAAFSNAVAYPGTSSINWYQAGSILATSVTSAVDAAARVKLHCGGLGTGTDFIVDVIGYYE